MSVLPAFAETLMTFDISAASQLIVMEMLLLPKPHVVTVLDGVVALDASSANRRRS